MSGKCSWCSRDALKLFAVFFGTTHKVCESCKQTVSSKKRRR